MRRFLPLALAVVLAPAALSAQEKPTLIVRPLTAAADVVLPYDLPQLHDQIVAEFEVMLGKDFEIASEPPAPPHGRLYTLDVEITRWQAGNTVKRLIVGLGSGREAADIHYRVDDQSGNTVLDRRDTIRTQFYAQGKGSTGTLGHPFADKIAERIKDAKLK
jgi:hypothetical protein